MLERVTGFIIKTQDFRENNKIITIFSKRFGKFSALARGAKKPNSRMAAITQPFIYGEFLVYLSKGLSTLQQGEIVNSHRDIREDIHKTTYASYIAEMTEKTLPEKEPHSYIFNQFKQTLLWIEEHRDAMIPIMMYELKLYQIAGIRPIVDRCALCSNNKNLKVFSIVEGGVLCAECRQRDRHAIKLSPAMIKLLPLFMTVDLERVGNITVRKDNQQRLRHILDEYYDRYGGYYIKSRNVLRQLDLLS